MTSLSLTILTGFCYPVEISCVLFCLFSFELVSEVKPGSLKNDISLNFETVIEFP